MTIYLFRGSHAIVHQLPIFVANKILIQEESISACHGKKTGESKLLAAICIFGGLIDCFFVYLCWKKRSKAMPPRRRPPHYTRIKETVYTTQSTNGKRIMTLGPRTIGLSIGPQSSSKDFLFFIRIGTQFVHRLRWKFISMFRYVVQRLCWYVQVSLLPLAVEVWEMPPKKKIQITQSPKYEACSAQLHKFLIHS